MSSLEDDKSYTLAELETAQYANEALQDMRAEALQRAAGKRLTCCTYDEGYINQSVFVCRTCTKGEAGLCLACARQCHDADTCELEELWTRRDFRCDCGCPEKTERRCSFAQEPRQRNTRNRYGHNFSGRFCVCDKREEEVESEMIQCRFCEDWFHVACVPFLRDFVGEVPDVYMCKSCAQRVPFLLQLVGTGSFDTPETEIAKDSSAETEENAEPLKKRRRGHEAGCQRARFDVDVSAVLATVTAEGGIVIPEAKLTAFVRQVATCFECEHSLREARVFPWPLHLSEIYDNAVEHVSEMDVVADGQGDATTRLASEVRRRMAHRQREDNELMQETLASMDRTQLAALGEGLSTLRTVMRDWVGALQQSQQDSDGAVVVSVQHVDALKAHLQELSKKRRRPSS
ncbi:MAG: hypothetical protein MHM6MM_002226 [Cercozoa sp. M6MM]